MRCAGVLLLALAAAVGRAQEPEVAAQDQTPRFRTRVNLVLVPVAVRDRNGRAAGGLAREDFEIFDRGKRQPITQFDVQSGGGQNTAPFGRGSVARASGTEPERAPRRFVAFVFDDIHLKTGDLAWVRDGVDRNLSTLAPADRAAIFTTSGRTALEFTGDRAKLRETLGKLRPNPISQPGAAECPDVSYFLGKAIWEREETSGAQPLRALTQETMECLRLTHRMRETARKYAEAAARRAVARGEHETHAATMALKQVVRRMGAMPGSRTIVLLSPGFLALEDARPAVLDAIDLAARLNVVISALDARGLYTGMDTRDMGRRLTIEPWAMEIKQQYNRMAAQAEAAVLAEVAEGTGGKFVEKTNDIDGGLKQVATAPEFLYVLGFAPREIAPDGSFHPLKIRVKPKNLTVQARRGYYASKQLTDPAEAARQEIEDAVFAPEDIRDPAVEVHTEFVKSGAATAELAVLVRLDYQRIRLEKLEGRNTNELTIVACVFDRNGNYLSGRQKEVKLRLRDETLAAPLNAGFIDRTSFEVAPGVYAVRVAVRDRHGQLMSAESVIVEIP